MIQSYRLLAWNAGGMAQAQAPQPAVPSPPSPTPALPPDAAAWSASSWQLAELRDLLAQLIAQMSQIALPPAAPTPAQPSKRATKFTISSFNILGSSHTKPGADAAEYAAGPTRIRWAAQLLKAKNIDVVGFQELNPDQAREFKKVAGDTYGLFPGDTKQSMASRNSLAWRKDQWDFVKGHTVKVTSHKGNMWPVPVVRLRNKETGQEAYFLNFHNAPGFHKGLQQHNRDLATNQEVALINKLKATGLPVIVTGDMNETQHYAARLAQEAGMTAANALPGGRLPKRAGIDWIFGSQGVSFKGFFRERGALERKISDHGMIGSRVRIG